MEALAAARSVVYDHYNIEHGENWELLESVAGLYNRLVNWDAALFHSTTPTTTQPGTIRQRNGDYAILTTDPDDAPWFVSERLGRRYWASHEEVNDWRVREISYPAVV